ARWITPFSGPILCFSLQFYFAFIFGGGAEENAPPQLRISHHIIPRLAHVGEQQFGVLAHESVCDLLNRGADLGHVWQATLSRQHLYLELQQRRGGLTISFPRPMVNVMP